MAGWPSVSEARASVPLIGEPSDAADSRSSGASWIAYCREPLIAAVISVVG